MLGGGQTSMEALLLKRHIKGPCWLSLAEPTRVDPHHQVRLPSSSRVTRLCRRRYVTFFNPNLVNPYLVNASELASHVM